MWYKVEDHRVIVIWDAVGYYFEAADKLNTFELIFTDGTDPLIGIGNNVAFSYDDMQWTTGDASGGSGGFGGTPATVGVNKGDGSTFALVGRFDHEGVDYDGPGGVPDGVSYLDCKNFLFSTSTAVNIPPVASGFPASPVTIYVGDIWNYTVQFLSPEIGQTTSTVVDASGLSDFTYISTTGNVSQIDMQLTGTLSNLGTHTIIFTATDNGVPVGVTTVYLEVIIIELQCVNPTYGGEIGFAQSHCGGLDPDPFVSLAPPSGFTGNLEFKWQFSTDMVNFLDIPFSNVEAYDAGFTDVTTWFKRLARVDCKPDWTGAAESNVVEITILPGILPGPAGVITGQAVVCNYSQAIYCVPYITDATSYIWEYSGTGVIFVEMTKCQSCIILQFTGEATSGILTVRGHNDCGDGLVSPDFPILVEPYPADAGPITGPIKVNQGQTGVPYSVPVIANATSYIWSYDGTGVTINGSGNSVTLDFDATATSGWLTVAGNNNCGNGLYTFLPITVDPYTPIYGPAIVAPGQSNVPYFVNKAPNVSNYFWSYTGSGATINSKSNIISIDFSKNASSGDLIVTGMINGGEAFESVLPVKVESGFSNNNGKSSGTISENETIEVFPNPANEVINVSSASGLKRILVTNSTGQIIYNEEIAGTNSQVDISDFIPGIYFIKIETHNNTVVKKVSVR